MPNSDQSWPPSPSNFNGPDSGPGMTGSGPPARHGCLTAWLVVALIGHSLSVLMYTLLYRTIHRGLPAVTPLVAGLLVVAALAGIACVLALFQWRRWGFYGVVAITLLVVGLNLSLGVGVGQSLGGLLGIGLLYWVLNMGGRNSAWHYLK